jgi:hypothetical protein
MKQTYLLALTALATLQVVCASASAIKPKPQRSTAGITTRPRLQRNVAVTAKPKPSSPTIKQQPKSPTGSAAKQKPQHNAPNLRADRERMRELMWASTEPEQTQTEAYLSLPMLKGLVFSRYPFLTEPKWQSFINKIINRERQYNDTHYVFYHAFSKAWLVPGDFYLALYKRLRPINMAIEDFRFLRFEPTATKDVNSFLIQELNAEGLVHDHTPSARAAMISVNFSLFGNTNNDGESSFHYFLKPTSHATVGDWMWESILKQFHAPIDPTVIKQLAALDSTYLSPELKNKGDPSEQAILQIFVPKELVDRVAYLSYIEGIPHDRKLINWIESIAKDSPNRSMHYDKAKDVTQAIRTLFKERPDHPLKQQILSEIKNNAFYVSPFLEEYKKNPQLIPKLNEIQARLFFTAEGLLHPSNNVLFFEYDFIPPEKKAAYHKALNNIADKVALQVLAKAIKASQSVPTPATKNTQAPTAAPSVTENRIAELQIAARKILSLNPAERRAALQAKEELKALQNNNQLLK